MTTDLEIVDAVVLAGGVNTIALSPGVSSRCKALVPFNGKPSILYVVEALRSLSSRLRRICIVGPQDEIGPVLPADAECEFVPAGKTVAGSLVRGVSHFRDSPAVLVVTADLPLVTAEAVSDFLEGCACGPRPGHGDPIYLSVVPEEAFSGAYSGFAKGFARFRGGAVSHGNLALLEPRTLRHSRLTEGLDALYERRKSSLRTSFALGWRIGLGYLIGAHLLRRMSLEQMASLVSSQFGVDLVPVSLRHPGIALDVDEPSDYALVRRLLEEGDGAGREGEAVRSAPGGGDHG